MSDNKSILPQRLYASLFDTALASAFWFLSPASPIHYFPVIHKILRSVGIAWLSCLFNHLCMHCIALQTVQIAFKLYVSVFIVSVTHPPCLKLEKLSQACVILFVQSKMPYLKHVACLLCLCLYFSFVWLIYNLAQPPKEYMTNTKHLYLHVCVLKQTFCSWCFHSEAAISLPYEPVYKKCIAVRPADHSEASVVLNNDNPTQILTSIHSLAILHAYSLTTCHAHDLHCSVCTRSNMRHESSSKITPLLNCSLVFASCG